MEPEAVYRTACAMCIACYACTIATRPIVIPSAQGLSQTTDFRWDHDSEDGQSHPTDVETWGDLISGCAVKATGKSADIVSIQSCQRRLQGGFCDPERFYK